MAIDPSIPLQAKAPQMQDPLEQYGRVQSIKANQLALQEGQRKMAVQDAFRNALASGADLNDPAVVNKLMAIDPPSAMAMQEQQAKLKKTSFETSELGHKVLMRKLGSLAADPSDAAVVASLQESVAQGLIDPAAAEAQLQRVMAMPLAERSKFFTETAINANTRYQGGITREGHRNQANIAAANRANQRDMADARARQPKYVEGLGMVSPDGRVTPVVGANGKVLTAEQVAAAKERGKVLGKQQAAAPAAIDTAKDALRKIDEMIGSRDGKIKQHPGFKTVGLNFFGRHISGTPSSDFKIRHEEVTGQAFMQAFETLKGGGQITQVEGEKATAAITRLNLSQSEAEYKKAAREFQDVLRAGIRRAEQNLGKNSTGQAGSAPTGTYNGRRVIMNPDGSINYVD